MPEITLTVADLYRIIGEKEVVICKLQAERNALQAEVLRLLDQVQALKRAEAGSDGKPA